MTDEAVRAVALPGPEPHWRHAAEYQANPNPVLQMSLWDASGFENCALLRVEFGDVLRRLVLSAETSWEDASGDVEVAVLRLGRVMYAVWHYTGEPNRTTVAVRGVPEGERRPAVTGLLEVLGVGWEAVELWSEDRFRTSFPGGVDSAADGAASGREDSTGGGETSEREAGA